MYYLGIDLGGMSIKAGICSKEGEILKKMSCPTVTESGDRIMSDIGALANKIMAEFGISAHDIAFAGLASPGTADSDTGRIVYASTLPFLNYPVAQKLTELTGIKKVLIENDANAAAKGEAYAGAAKDYKNSIFITLGTGVGGGIIIDNKVYSGFNHAAAELGHIVIIHGGKPCGCGRRGCWESYASATALIAQTKEKMLSDASSLMWEICGGQLDKVNGKTSFDACRAGDKAGREVVDTYISYLASGIVSMINIFQPEVLSIGGGLSNEGDYLLDPLRAIVDAEQYSRKGDKKTIIKKASLGNDAGIVGAAMLGM